MAMMAMMEAVVEGVVTKGTVAWTTRAQRQHVVAWAPVAQRLQVQAAAAAVLLATQRARAPQQQLPVMLRRGRVPVAVRHWVVVPLSQQKRLWEEEDNAAPWPLL